VTCIGRAETVSQQWNTVKAGAFLQRAGSEACAFEKSPDRKAVGQEQTQPHTVLERVPASEEVSVSNLAHQTLSARATKAPTATNG